MQQRAIIITATILALAGCTNEDGPGVPTSSGGGSASASATATGGGDGADDGSGGGSGGSAGSGADSTTGDMCDDLQVEWECNVLAFVAYFDLTQQTYVTGVNKNGGPAQGPRPCVAPGDIAAGGAFDVASLLECGGMDGSPPPAASCVTECEKLTAADLGYDESIVLYPGTPAEETRTASILCLEHGEIPQSPWGGISSDVDGTCAFGADPQPTATTIPCGSSECAELEGECPNYTNGHNTTTTTSGNTIYAEIDYDWAQDLYGNVGLLWCDPGRYTFFDQSFFGLTTSSVMYQLGIRDGDTDLQVWKHDPSTFNRIGSVYTIQDVDDALDAFDAVVPAAGNDIHTTASVKRAGITKTIHVDIED